MSCRQVLICRCLFVLVILLATAAPSRAADKVHICVVSILATDKDDKVDPRLGALAREVKKLDPKLTGFSVDRMTCMNVDVGNKECFEVVDEQTVCVGVEKKSDKADKDDKRIRVKVTPPKLGAITYDTPYGKFYPVMTRYKTKDGKVLIVAVRVADKNPHKGDD